MVTAADANEIVALPKIIASNVSWKYLRPIYTLEANVLAVESDIVCRITGFIGKSNHSFVLLYRNTPIRKWTAHYKHRNPATGEVFTEPHKHTWDDVYEDKLVYIPDDIHVGDINVEFRDFLAECNITMRGEYIPFRRQEQPSEQLELELEEGDSNDEQS